MTDSNGDVDGLSPDQLSGQLQNAIAMRSSVEQVFWASFGMFWATNALFVIALVSAQPANRMALAIVPLLGVAQTAVWAIIQKRMLAHLARTEVLMERIEEGLVFGPKFAISLRIAEEDYKSFINKGFSTRVAVQTSIIGVGCVWLAVMGGLIFSAYAK
jgi:hypothetical protein